MKGLFIADNWTDVSFSGQLQYSVQFDVVADLYLQKRPHDQISYISLKTDLGMWQFVLLYSQW